MKIGDFELTSDEAEDIYSVDLSVEQVRAFVGGTEELEDFVSALDEAQGEVFTEEADRAFILIRIRP